MSKKGVIASACRTAIGSFGGTLANTPAPELGAVVIKAAIERAGIKPVLSGSFGGSDNNQFAQHGGRGIVIASAMYNCHTVHEYTRISDMVQVARIVMNLMTMEEDEKDEAAVTVSDQ